MRPNKGDFEVVIVNRLKEKGAVSLFVVAFATLLITVITISFVRIMIQDQQQASAADLSQSAYDSAQAGVEDAKRALLRYQSLCNSGDVAGCAMAKENISSSVCNSAVGTLNDINEFSSEVKIKTAEGDDSLDQAYTCVKINLQTNDYLGSLGQDESKMVPLVGSSDFDTIRIEWFSIKDLQTADMAVDVPSYNLGTPLLSQNNWTSGVNQNRPSIMRAQLIQLDDKSGFSLSDFNSNDDSMGSSRTLFLYPSSIPDNMKYFVDDRRNEPNEPTQVNCKSSLTGGGYACSATIKLPNIITDDEYKAYLNLTSLYKATSYRILLLDSDSKVVSFNAVQPEIDSTGRTSNLFRRVKSRVELTDVNFPYPEVEINIKDNFCKNFRITNNPADYVSNCNP